MSGPSSDHMRLATFLAKRPTRKRGYTRALALARYTFALDRIREIGARSALDLGCGIGYGSAMLAAEGIEVVGVDAGEQTLAAARSHFLSDRLALRYHRSRVEDLDLGRRFDAITFFEVIEHLEDPRPALDTCLRHLNAQGVVCLSTPNFEFLGRHSGNPHHAREYTVDELEALLGDYFEDVDVRLIAPPPGWEDFERQTRDDPLRKRRLADAGRLRRLAVKVRAALDPWRKSKRWALDPRTFSLVCPQGAHDRHSVAWAACRRPRRS